jgi:hypothetical protein
MSRLLTFPCHSVWSDSNQITGSIPSELGELTSLTTLWLCTWIGSSRSYKWHACSHFLAILLHQLLINSRVPFRANSENLRRWLYCGSVRGLVFLDLMKVTLAHISLPFFFNRWKSTHGSHSERNWRTDFADWAGAPYVDWFVLSHECHACSHFVANLFEQLIINSQVPFRANSENWLR